MTNHYKKILLLEFIMKFSIEIANKPFETGIERSAITVEQHAQGADSTSGCQCKSSIFSEDPGCYDELPQFCTAILEVVKKSASNSQFRKASTIETLSLENKGLEAIIPDVLDELEHLKILMEDG